MNISHIISLLKLRRVHVVITAIIAFLALIVVPFMSANAHADSDTEAPRDHIVTIYDYDKETTIVSKASTIKDALKDADISVSKYDSVDPAVDEKIDASSVIISIRRAKPVLVIDGQRQVRVITASQSTEDIIKAAGIAVYPEDVTKLSQVSDLLTSGGAGLQLTITRAKVVNLRLYGQDIKLRTQAKTVAGLLKEKGIVLGSEDGMDLANSTPITDEMSLRVWRNGIQTVTATEEIGFTTKTVNDSTKNVGYKEVQTTGKNGQKTVVYQIEMRDGQEISRSVISEVTDTPATEQVEIVGTKVSLPPGSHEDWMSAAGMSSGDYGYINYIFSRESGWRPGARSSNGRYVGLGQTSEANLSKSCPNWQSDPICQIKFFDSYAKSRYGSWSGAYNFWTSRSWW